MAPVLFQPIMDTPLAPLGFRMAPSTTLYRPLTKAGAISAKGWHRRGRRLRSGRCTWALAAASTERLESGRATPRRLHSSRGATHTPGPGTNPDGLDPNEYVFDRFWFHNLQIFPVPRNE